MATATATATRTGKVQMNSLDVAAEAMCLRRFVGMRCENIFELSPNKKYVLELGIGKRCGVSEFCKPIFLLMESGVRLHTTSYSWDTSNASSEFSGVLRKYIRTRRLKAVMQLGYDQIVRFQFGAGADEYNIIFELYGEGNLILTDRQFVILAQTRPHRDRGADIMVYHRYPFQKCIHVEQFDHAKFHAKLATVKNNPGKQTNLNSLLGEALGYGPAISEHIIVEAGLTPNMTVSSDLKLEDSNIKALLEGFKRFEDWLLSGNKVPATKVPSGYIMMQKKQVLVESSITSQIYYDFCPFLLKQFTSMVFVKYLTFDRALDDYYNGSFQLRLCKAESNRFNDEKVQEYKIIVQNILESHDYIELKILLNHLLSDDVPVSVSIKVMDYISSELKGLGSMGRSQLGFELGYCSVALAEGRIKAAQRVGMSLASCFDMSNLDYDMIFSPVLPLDLPAKEIDEHIQSWKDNSKRFYLHEVMP